MLKNTKLKIFNIDKKQQKLWTCFKW
jgi:hypothetical protein